MWNPFSARPRRRNGRNNNGQSSIIVPGERLGSLEDVAGAGTAPIVSVSVGSTGLNRVRLYHKVMDAMNCADRIQSMLVYDCNQVNINRLREDAAQAKPESTEAMGRGDDTKDDGQGKANGPGLIPIDGDEGGVR